MAENTNFESKEKLFRHFPHYSVREKRIRALGTRNTAASGGGVPISYDAERDIIAIDSSDTHTLIWGSTGSLKTRCVIMPTVKIIGKSGESMIISDPKGEIFNRCANELQENGYKIVVINIRNPEYGDAWNPLAIPYRLYLQGNLDLAAEYANDIAANIALEQRSERDPFWDDASSDCLYGLILLLFRYCKDHRLDESYVNISNLLELRRQLFKGGIQSKFSTLWKYAEEDELIAGSLSGSVYAPNETMHSILSVLDQKLRMFVIRPTLMDMLADNDIDIAEVSEKSVAVFLIIPDEKNTYNSLVALFIKQSYEYLIYKASNNENLKLQNRVNFILDEFSSLPPISSMSSMISAARSRDMRFVLAVQGAHQLKKRYGDEAETIKSNCLNWIYLTSRELDLLKEISQLCGEQRNHTPNISVYDLQHFSKEKCEALVMCGRLKPARVNLLDIDHFGEDSYIILEFEKKIRRKRSGTKFELDESILRRVSPVAADNPFKKPDKPVAPPPPQPKADEKKNTHSLWDRLSELSRAVAASWSEDEKRDADGEDILSDEDWKDILSDADLEDFLPDKDGDDLFSGEDLDLLPHADFLELLGLRSNDEDNENTDSETPARCPSSELTMPTMDVAEASDAIAERFAKSSDGKDNLETDPLAQILDHALHVIDSQIEEVQERRKKKTAGTSSNDDNSKEEQDA